MANDDQNQNIPTDEEQSGEDLAAEALAEAALEEVGAEDEVEASDKIAETLTTIQNLVERHANELENIKSELREHRSSLRNVFENDPELSAVQAELETHTSRVKERKSQLQSNPESMSLKAKIGELNEQKKELEETLSNHLVNYHALTHSNSFDTSDGDQWEFSISAKIKPRKKHKED